MSQSKCAKSASGPSPRDQSRDGQSPSDQSHSKQPRSDQPHLDQLQSKQSRSEQSITKGPGICPECGDVTALRYRPFCSKRCADVDLSRWLRGAYAIPGGDADADDDGDEADAADLARKADNPPRDDDGSGDNGFH